MQAGDTEHLRQTLAVWNAADCDNSEKVDRFGMMAAVQKVESSLICAVSRIIHWFVASLIQLLVSS